MSRRLILGSVVTFALAATSNTAARQAQQPTFRARTEVVTVNVSVIKGRDAVTGLRATDFQLTDNGVLQTIDAISLEQVPLDLTLVLTGFSAERAYDQARGLVSAEATRQLLRPADRLRIVWANDDVRGGLVGPDYSMTTDPAYKELAAARGNRITFVAGPDQKTGFGVALADGLFYALAWPVDADRRHLVVAFTDGWDTASTLEMATLPAFAAHSDAVLHAVFWATPGEDTRSGGGLNIVGGEASWTRAWETSYRVVDEVVQRTGGTLQRTSHAPEALASIIADFRTSYMLRYTPRGVAEGGWHDLRVEMTRPGSFKIRARKGYEGG